MILAIHEFWFRMTWSSMACYLVKDVARGHVKLQRSGFNTAEYHHWHMSSWVTQSMHTKICCIVLSFGIYIIEWHNQCTQSILSVLEQHNLVECSTWLSVPMVCVFNSLHYHLRTKWSAFFIKMWQCKITTSMNNWSVASADSGLGFTTKMNNVTRNEQKKQRCQSSKVWARTTAEQSRWPRPRKIQ